MFKRLQKPSPSPPRSETARVSAASSKTLGGGARDVSPPRLPVFLRGGSPPRLPVFGAQPAAVANTGAKRAGSPVHSDVKYPKPSGSSRAGQEQRWSSPATPEERAASEMQAALRRNFDSLLEGIGSSGPITLLPFEEPMRYSAVIGGGYMKQHAGFTLFKHPATVFVNAWRRQPKTSSGDKLHVSVDETRVDDAFDAIAHMLFSQDSPIDQWKIIDTQRTRGLKDERVSRGAQITLHVEPSDGGAYSALDLRRIRDLIGLIEARLTECGIDAGVRPESDVAAQSWKYVSYRNEYRSAREQAGDAQRDRLANEPFFKLISGD